MALVVCGTCSQHNASISSLAMSTAAAMLLVGLARSCLRVNREGIHIHHCCVRSQRYLKKPSTA